MFEDDTDSDDSLPLRELLRIAGGACADCRVRFTPKEAVFSIALGFKNAARCLACLAARLERDPDELRAQLVQYIHARECYLKAWREAERRQGEQPEGRGQRMEERQEDRRQKVEEKQDEPAPARSRLVPAERWHAGDIGCGELVMALRGRMNSLPAGAVIHVVATDPAAPEDLPAWCRLTGHPLLSADHPNYFIQRKGA